MSTRRGKVDEAVAKVFALFDDGVWVAMVRDNGQEDPARVWSRVERDERHAALVAPVVFAHENGTQLATGTYTAAALYDRAGEFLTEMKLGRSHAICGGVDYEITPAPWWRFWNRADEVREIPGDTFTLTHGVMKTGWR
jgi:hypothetical protein